MIKIDKDHVFGLLNNYYYSHAMAKIKGNTKKCICVGVRSKSKNVFKLST